MRRFCVAGLSVALLYASLCTSALGIVRDWDDEGATSDWSEAANWSDDGVPATTDDVFIGSLADAFDDSVILDVNADLVRSLTLTNGADFNTNGGRVVATTDVSVGTGAASGTTPSEVVVAKRNAVGPAAFALDANRLFIGANGVLSLPDGGQVDLDGTGPQAGVLSVADGGAVVGYGQIELSDTDASLGVLTSLIENEGSITVEDPLFTGLGEPTAVTLHVTASNAPMFAQLDLAGASGTGSVDITRNGTLILDSAYIGPNNLTMAGNTTLQAQNGGSLGTDQTIEVNSGIVNFGGVNELPAAPAVITGDGLLSTAGIIRLNLVAEELIIETPIDATGGLISNRGTVRFRGGGNIREVELNSLDSGLFVNESVDVLSFQGGQTYDASLSNAGALGVEEFSGDATVEFASYEQTDAGTLEIDISGELAGEFDVLSVMNEVMIDGLLQVTLAEAFEPTLGSSFTILTSQNGMVGGQFATTDFPVFSGKTFDVVYNDSSVELQVISTGGPAGDFDGDGDVDGADFLLWQQGGSPDPLSATDLADWQMNYGATAPEAVATAAVPEPTSLCCLLAFATIATAVRRR